MFQAKENPTPQENRQQRRRRRRRLYRLRQRIIELSILTAVVGMVALPIWWFCGRHAEKKPSAADQPSVSTPADAGNEVAPLLVTTPHTEALGDFVDAKEAILIDVTANTVVASKNPTARVYPASVTKVMTLLVGVEHIQDYTQTVTMPYELLNDLFAQEATVAGFSAGEKVNMTDLLYGTILPSGADATWGIAYHVAGSEKAFAELMNEKAAAIGMKNTHFANCSGLHDPNHYTTAEDMALLMREAMKNPLCRKVLGTYQYTTASTPEHPDGLLLTSTMYSRMKGDEPEVATVLGGKTGYTTQAGHTMVSFAKGNDGHEYVFASMGGSNRWQATYDAIHVYAKYGNTATS